jgi:hypothetical protein
VRDALREAARLRRPSLRAALPCGRVRAVYDRVRQAAQVLVRPLRVSSCAEVLTAVRSFPEIHPCTAPCHAPSSCPETEPCMASVTLSCACGRIQQQAPCGRCTGSPAGRAGGAGATLKCTNECAVARRNARLAEALGIAPGDRAGAAATYPDDTQAFARSDRKFLALVERTLDGFARGEKRTQVLPHMPPDRRKFVTSVRRPLPLGCVLGC